MFSRSVSRSIYATALLVAVCKALTLGGCDRPLGMESGAIPDEAITASSSYVPNVGPRNGRLRVERAGGGWCPKLPIEKGVVEYLQVDLGDVHVISGIQTQGRYDRGRGQEYAEEYTLEYWRPGFNEWKEYRKWDGRQILRGNSDTSTVESQRLMPVIFASKIRVLPYSVHRRTVCMRLELLGCLYEDGIISYSAPEGSEPSLGLMDISYDGQKDNGFLQGGLGRLVDGEIGMDNFRLDIGVGKGNGWVGWKNESMAKGYVELVFEFDQVRNFSGVHLFTSNVYSKGVQVFSRAKVMFSLGGQAYNGKILSYSYMPDLVLEKARNVSIHLLHRIARFVKLRLFFADRWIMLSEIYFDSVPVALNITEEEISEAEGNELVVNMDKKEEKFETIAARKGDNSYVEIVIGVLTAVMLLLLIVFVVVLVLSKRHKFQGSPAFFKNPFGVKINMKDLLMSFSSNNAAQSTNPTSTAPELTVADSTPSFEQYRSPLMSDYYAAPNYASLRCSSAPEDDIPDVPPLPESPQLHSSPVVSGSSPVHYRSLQSTPIVSPKTKVINLENYFPNGTETVGRKRYHTAPREKHRVPPPVICWNIAPSMGVPYNCKEVELVPVPRYCLKPLERLGSCHAGEISLYETENLEDIIPNAGRLVVVRTMSPEAAKADAATGSMESLREVRFLAGLSDPNVCRVLGVCTAEQPPWTVIEYGDMGNLTQYLQFLANKNGTIRKSGDPATSIGCLLYMATQISSGMKYLESRHIVHKDLAARNCLVGRGYLIKIADMAMCMPQFNKDYAEIGGRPPAPIRWLPWESILLDRYTCSSSVWSFAVTLWEILSFANERPFHNLSNEKVIQNAEHMYYGGELQVLLSKPPICTSEIYELMCQCWRRDDTSRPTFKQIFYFLRHSNKDYTCVD